MKPVRTAVIGVGMMGTHHARDVNDLQNCELAAVCDVDPARAEACAGEFEVPAFTDYQALLANVDLDAVVIATPHTSHPAMATAAFKRGIHVLVEKPIAVHVQAAQEMIDGYEKALERFPKLLSLSIRSCCCPICDQFRT